MEYRDIAFFDSKEYKLTLSLVTAVFFYIFILFFLPFGVDNYDPNHKYTLTFLLEIFYFFLVVFTVSMVNEFLIRPLFFTRSNPRRIVLWSLWSLLLHATALFFIYNWVGNWHDFRFVSYLGFLKDIPGIFIFPMTGVFFYFRYRSLQTHIEKIATQKEPEADPNRLLTFTGSGSKDRITMAASAFLYGKAQDNYVELFYLENDAEKKFVIRATLSHLTRSIADEKICRCHRSYMVNLQHVRSIKGSKQDTTLYLSPLNTPIPVSGSYRKTVMESLRLQEN